MLAKPGCDLRWYLLDLSFSTEYPPNIQPSVSECHRAEEWSLLVLLYSCLAFAPLTSSHSVHGRCFPLPVVQTVFFPIWNIPNFIFYKNCFKLFSISDSQPHRKVFCRKLWHPPHCAVCLPHRAFSAEYGSCCKFLLKNLRYGRYSSKLRKELNVL